jgi:hypothetical protein
MKSEEFMKIFVQQKWSGLYCKETGEWTHNQREAFDFRHSGTAVKFCLARNLSQIRIVMRFDDQAYDVCVEEQELREDADHREVSSTREVEWLSEPAISLA